MAAVATRRSKAPGINASPEEVDNYLKRLEAERETHTRAANDIDQEMMAIHDRLTATLTRNGKLPNNRRARSNGGSGGVRAEAGTGKILGIIKRLAKGNPPHVRTGDVAREAESRFKIKYPHSSFQSLQTAGVIKLKSPQRGYITLLKK